MSLFDTKVYVVSGVAVFIVAFFGAYIADVSSPDISVEWSRSVGTEQYVPRMQAETGHELALIYIGSSSCAASNRLQLPAWIEELKLRVQRHAENEGKSFVAIGVAKDWSPENGIRHLNNFGRFDEVMAGRNWLNVGALKYMWEDIPGEAATPQILVVDRSVEVPGENQAGYSIGNERLLVRKAGTREIRQWLEHGAPLPTAADL